MVTASVGLILIPFILSIGGYVLGGETDSTAFLEAPAGASDRCVDSVEDMRFHHMDLLKEIRARVVRDGKRSDITLDTCRSCHPSRERFCNRCHDAASVVLDCFGCHYYPSESVTGQ